MIFFSPIHYFNAFNIIYFVSLAKFLIPFNIFKFPTNKFDSISSKHPSSSKSSFTIWIRSVRAEQLSDGLGIRNNMFLISL